MWAPVLLLVFSLQLYAQALMDLNCELCSFQVDEAIGCVNQLLKNFDPYPLEKLSPCSRCNVSGISNFNRSAGYVVCSKEAANGGTKHKFRITFKNVTLDCICDLPQQAHQLIEAAAATAGTIAPQNCQAETKAEVIGSFTKTTLPPISVMDWLGSTQCKKLSNVIPEEIQGSSQVSELDKPAVTNGNMYAEWLNFEVTFVSTTQPNSDRVVISDLAFVLNAGDGYPIKMWCDGSSQFNDSCNCLVAGQFPVYLMVQAVHMILPCRVDEESVKRHDIVDYFKCDKN